MFRVFLQYNRRTIYKDTRRGVMARFTIDLSGDFEEKLSGLAEGKGTTKAEILKRALVTYSVLDREAKKDGQAVSITREGEVVKEIILP